MDTTTPQLVARDLFQSFRMGPRRIEVLRGISMEVGRDEAVFLSGASGAGKTTLLYTLAGLGVLNPGRSNSRHEIFTTARRRRRRDFEIAKWVSYSRDIFSCRS